MATRTETRFGEVTSLGTTYVICGAAVPSATVWNVLLVVTNRTGASANLRAYIADTSWSSGEPTAGTLKVAVAYDLTISAGAVVEISGFVMNATEKLVVRSSVAASLDVSANGIAIT
jgi:hypothetical protein